MNNREAAKHCIEELHKRGLEKATNGTAIALVEVYPNRWAVISFSDEEGKAGSRLALMLSNYVVDSLRLNLQEEELPHTEVAKSPEHLLAGAPNITAVGGEDV